ncbi:Ultraviolet-B receptor UVR8 [Glycine soja]
MAMNNGDGTDGGALQRVLYMWGYLPGALPQRTPLLTPVAVRVPPCDYSWNDVCGGGCGFAIAISESGKLITWGSTDDLGQSYVTSGKHGETPEPFPLPTETSIVKAAAGWAHCVAVTEHGEVYTWGWKECIPSGKVFGESSTGVSLEKDVPGRHTPLFTEQGMFDLFTMTAYVQLVVPPKEWSKQAKVHQKRSGGYMIESLESEKKEEKMFYGLPLYDEPSFPTWINSGEESTKRRRVSSAKQTAESSSSSDDSLTAFPCLVTLNPGIRIASVAAGGRHTLALSDTGLVWAWGYGGEGQLGLGSRIRMVSTPHLVPCIDSSYYVKDRSATLARGNMGSEGQTFRIPGSYIKRIACGGRHSAVITVNSYVLILEYLSVELTDAGALLTFGWGLYGQMWFTLTRDYLFYSFTIFHLSCHLLVNACFCSLYFIYVILFFIKCGQGITDDELSPTCVSSLLGIHIEGIAAGLWHTVCTSADGDVYAFGGNQFGQLGTGADQAELGLGDVIDRNIPSEVTIEGCVPKNVACGWWHTLLLAESHT